MNHEILTSTPMRDAQTLTRAAFEVPAGACDAHVHVFGPAERYPRVEHPHYTLPDGNLPHLQRALGVLDVERFVMVQPSFYGTDNRCMLDALDAAGDRARGVAMADDDVSEEALRAKLPCAELHSYIERGIQRIRPLGWHVQFYTPGWVVRDLIPVLPDLETDFVIDHMGYMLESDGLTRGDFDRLLRAVADGRGWFKLSGPYRLAKDGNYARLKPLAQAIVDAVPDRVIWGSDWPHIPVGGRDTGELLNLLGDWIPDPTARRKVLADNPSRLFGF